MRDRKDDIPLLCSTLIHDLNRKHGCHVAELSGQAVERLMQHSWPGNVRELRNVLERAVILAGEGTIGVTHLPAQFQGAGSAHPTAEAGGGSQVSLPVGITIDQAERALIEITLQHTKNNKTRAAEILGISLKTLFNKLKGYGGPDTEETNAN